MPFSRESAALQQLEIHLRDVASALADCKEKSSDRGRHTVKGSYRDGLYQGQREAYAHARDLVAREIAYLERFHERQATAS